MKKFISVLLAAVMIFAMSIPSLAVSYDEHPTIYVTGARVNHIYAADGSLLFPNNADAGQVLKDAIKPCLEKLAKGVIMNDYEEWATELRDAFVKVFGGLNLDKNGEASDGSYPEHPYNYSLPVKTSNYGGYDYRLWYDWRLSPLDTAEYLKLYVEEVKAVTGEEKVNIIGRCYGANVVQAYLALYPEHALAHVDDVAYLSSSVNGIEGLGALFSGEIKLDDQAITNFVDYFMNNSDIIEDDTTKSLILATVELLNYIKLLGLTGEALELFIERVKKDVFPLVLLDTFAGWPSYWSMVPVEDYEDAKALIFDGIEEEYAGFIKKCDEYRNKVQLKAEETLKYLDGEGIDFYMVSKYNFPEAPVHENALNLSDGFTSVKRQSFGAICANHGELLSERYINNLIDKRYLSPDRKIDASTCLFPETSYFIKNMYHDTFPAPINNLAIDLMNHDATVSGGEYAQYTLYDGSNELKVISGQDENDTVEKEPFYMIFIRFFTTFIEFLKKLIGNNG